MTYHFTPPTVETHSSKLHDSNKTLRRSLSMLCRKRKSKETLNPNLLK